MNITKEDVGMNNREIDALVAEKVMGLEIIRGEGVRYAGPNGFDNMYIEMGSWNGESQTKYVPLYSTRIQDAWQVVDKMKSNGWYALIVEAEKTGVCFDSNLHDETVTHDCDSIPEAICFAALKAVGELCL